MVTYGNKIPIKKYYQMSTTNQSFKNVHYILKALGIKHNKFMMVLLDPDLAGVDPFDKRLNDMMKAKIIKECLHNYWYFLREVVRIPSAGGMGTGTKYELTRGNLALNYCMAINLNIFLEMPRQQGKTMSALCRYLYLFNFGTTQSEMAFLNKKLEDSKINLQRLKELREALPSYLQMSETISNDGKRVKATNTVMALQHPVNGNKIRAMASATSKTQAASLLRGRTIPLLYFDEFAFFAHNDTVYLNGVPAFKTASNYAKMNGAPYGMLITTTPGFLTTDEGKYAYEFKESATKFSELWYDMPYDVLMNLINANNYSSFVYIRFTYQELGKSEEWFKDQCREMQLKYPDIRREILLEWSAAPENCPFSQEQLDGIRELVKSPISQTLFLGKYLFNIYDRLSLNNPPIIGVDVSGGYRRDSSAIVIIDSSTTKVFADMNCNYIPPTDLARVIYELVTTRMPNAIVNVERNGGFGASVLAQLIATRVKRNLYYEFKERVIEEYSGTSGNGIRKKTETKKVFGLDSTKTVRDTLIQILRERVEYHKDKFVSRELYDELRGMECKRNGKIEHSSNTHDDSVFALLMALYVWYEGKDIMQRYGIRKNAIKTDAALEEAVFSLEEKCSDIACELVETEDTEIDVQLGTMKQSIGKLHHEWVKEQLEKDDRAMQAILATRIGKEAYSKQFNTPIEELQEAMFTIPDNIFDSFYSNEESNDDTNMFQF